MSENRLSDWREEDYLAANPDVQESVARGEVADGYTHWVTCGQFEDRPGATLKTGAAGTTRYCTDPWINAEFDPDGAVKMCCVNNTHESLDDFADLEQLRQAAPFRQLRHDLLTGNLPFACRACHIRPTVPTQRLVRDICGHDQGRISPLNPGQLTTARVDINEKCNLRCVYCAVSQPSYVGRQMQDEQMDRLTTILAGYGGLRALSVNGHGETTHHPRWKEFCRPLLAQGLPLTIITNMGRTLTDEDIDVLSRFKVIQVSLDMANADLLKRIRRKVDLSRILYNINMIRTHALLTQGRTPEFSFSTGLYDLSMQHLEHFAWFTVTLGVATVTFWNLKQYPDIPGEIRVRALDSLEPAALAEALACYDRAMAVLTRFGVKVEVAGGFIDELKRKLEPVAEEAVTS